MISQSYSPGTIKILFRAFVILIFPFFFCGCSSYPKTTTSVESPSSSKTLVDHGRKVATRDWRELISYIKASNTGVKDEFGYSVSLSADGNTLAVGALYEDSENNKANNSGAVYVFTRDGNEWDQQEYIKASNAGIHDLFGYSVSLSADGNILVVGAPYEDSKAQGIGGDQENNGAKNSGAVYVFTRDGNEWSQQEYIKASNTETDDSFGKSLNLSADGSTLVVGAPYEDSKAQGIGGDQENNGAKNSGAVYVFTRDGNGWSQQEYIKAYNSEAFDMFGKSLNLSADGSTLVVGAPYKTRDTGAVYVFTRDGNGWSQQEYIKASNAEGHNEGAFSVFVDDGDVFGYSVSLSADGNTLAVGALGEDSKAQGVGGDQTNNEKRKSGAVYVFTRNGNEWDQQEYIKASNTEIYDRFGNSLSLSADGNILAVGAFYEDSSARGVGGDQENNEAKESGAAYMFARDENGKWTQQSYIKASNTGVKDFFGNSLSLSADGNILAVGAIGEDSSSKKVGGNQENNRAENPGAVYVYTGLNPVKEK